MTGCLSECFVKRKDAEDYRQWEENDIGGTDALIKQKLILPIEISYLRMVAQLLLPSVRKQTIPDVVEHMLAMQGQQVYSFPHAALIRSLHTNFEDVKKAFENYLLVRHRPMRGTVHITCAKDYHWLRLALNQKPSAFIRRQESLAGISESMFMEAAESAWEYITQCHDIGISRQDLFARWKRQFQNRISSEVSDTGICQLLMWGLDRRGLLVEGPLRKNQHLFIDGRLFPAADSTESGFCFHEGISTEDALVEVAYRYARGHGPVSIADFSRWAGLSKKASREALDSNVTYGRLKRYTMTEETFKDYDPNCDFRQVYYMQPQLIKTLEDSCEEWKQILFLPSFDELHVGYENRTCLTDEVGENAICPAKNGMFKPLIVKDGRLIAVYSKDDLFCLKELNPQLKKDIYEVIENIQSRMER